MAGIFKFCPKIRKTFLFEIWFNMQIADKRHLFVVPEKKLFG